MKPLDFRRDRSRANPLAGAVARANRKRRSSDDKMAENTILDRGFDKFDIDPDELRAPIDAGRHRRPSAE